MLPQVVAESSWFYSFFTGGPVRVSVGAATVSFESRGALGGSGVKVAVGSIESVWVHRFWFWGRLTISAGDGTELSIGGLKKSRALQIYDAVLAEAARQAEVWGWGLKQVDRRLQDVFSGRRYVRYSEFSVLWEAIEDEMKRCSRLVRQHLDRDAGDAFGRLTRLGSAEVAERVREDANGTFVSMCVPTVQAAARRALPVDLTREQAEAIATDEDTTLVLAGAGTGKTSVIVGKVAHLVRYQGVPAGEVLVVSYNHKAAAEIKKRLSGDLSSVEVSTFHAFGRRVVKDSEGRTPRVSRLAGDKKGALRKALENILNEILDDPRQSRAVTEFITYHRRPYRSAFHFKTRAEYDDYIRHVELRTLSGDLVRSFEELTIANYLTEHGIAFEYERDYERNTKTEEYRQYRPDFFLPDYRIYIEHFALDEEGQPPPGWEGYGEGVNWKRKTHGHCGTKLIETFSWQYRQGSLHCRLRKTLEAEGVRFERVPVQELIDQLRDSVFPSLAKLLAGFLNHVKTSSLTSEVLRARADAHPDGRRNRVFLDVFEQVHEHYQQLLSEENALDYHDMINRGAAYISANRWETPFRYVLVDEFQDISAGRMELLKALERPNTAFFLVGDDWQSIYRFAGSDVGLVRNCGSYLGHVKERTLTLTFRYAEGILGPSTSFIQRNPDQTQRPLRPARTNTDEGITIIADANPQKGVMRALADIKTPTSDKSLSVLVLGRYNHSDQALPEPLPRGVEFSTVHRAKGREADYLVVLDLKDGRWGFPSREKDDPVIDLVLPPTAGISYPFAEERRLFYVAMTRARRGAYLITDRERPSPFVTELFRQTGSLRQLGKFPPKCPRCVSGRLVERTGRFGVFLGCTEYRSTPSCTYTESITNGAR